MLRAGRMPHGITAVEHLRAQLNARLAGGDLGEDADAVCRSTLAELIDIEAAGEKMCPFEPDVAQMMIAQLMPMAAPNRAASALLAVDLLRSRYGIIVTFDYIKNLYKRNYPDFGQIRTPTEWAEFKLKKEYRQYLPRIVSTFF